MPCTHVVMFKFKDEVVPKDIVSALNEMVDLKNNCIHPATAKPYITSAKGGRENSIEGVQNGFTHVVVMEFNNTEDRDYYVRTDPTHLIFAQKVRTLAEKVQVVDFTPGTW